MRPVEAPRARGRERHRVDVGGLAFRVLSSRTGRRGPPAFVLVHGIGMSHRYLDRLHRELADAGEVHSIDLPGFGGLPAPPRTLTVAQMSDALGTLMDHLGLRGAVLVGHSMGTQWVLELAVQRPDLASHVVVIGPVSDDRHRTVRAQAAALAVDTLGEPIGGNALVFSDYVRSDLRWYLRQLREMVAYRIEDRAAVLAVPLLVVRGEDDPIAGIAWARRLRDSASRSVLVNIPGHRHLAQHSAPRAVARAIRAFLARHPPPSARGPKTAGVPEMAAAVPG